MKNQKGISLIALIITIIVIIILAAIVIGGVFNTPNDAKFANFCQEYDRVQTAIQLRYYELYQQYAIGNTAQVPTHFAIYAQVADGSLASKTLNTATYDSIGWVEVKFTAEDRTLLDAQDKPLKDGSKLCDAPNGLTGKWFLRTSDGKLAYAGFEKSEADMYYTPSVHADGSVVSGKPRATLDNSGNSYPNNTLVLSPAVSDADLSDLAPASNGS